MRTGREDILRLYSGRYTLPKADRYRSLTGATVRMLVPTANGEREIIAEVVLTENVDREQISGRSKSSRNGVWIVPHETVGASLDTTGQSFTMAKLPCPPEYVRGNVNYHVKPIWTDPSPSKQPSFYPRAYFVERKRIIEIIAESISAYLIEAGWSAKAKAKRWRYKRAARKRRKTMAAKRKIALQAATSKNGHCAN